MDIKSLEDLRRPDERTLRFAPLGLAMGGMLRPEDAALFQQETISHAEVVPAVPESTRDTFGRLRLLFSYGVLCYEIFTIVEDQAHLVLEHALRERFWAFYDGVVPMEDNAGQLHPVRAARLDELFQEIRKVSRVRGGNRRRLRLRQTGELIGFDGMLASLLRWARGEGLLRGQRNRMLEPYLKRFRNHVAHGAGDHLVMPVDAARTVSDLAEIINQVWGAPTPGGKLYPAPIAREIQAVAWGPDTVTSGPVGNFPALPEHDDWTYALVRAVRHDPGLMRLMPSTRRQRIPATCCGVQAPGKTLSPGSRRSSHSRMKWMSWTGYSWCSITRTVFTCRAAQTLLPGWPKENAAAAGTSSKPTPLKMRSGIPATKSRIHRPGRATGRARSVLRKASVQGHGRR